jgi:hypothetical protein
MSYVFGATAATLPPHEMDGAKAMNANPKALSKPLAESSSSPEDILLQKADSARIAKNNKAAAELYWEFFQTYPGSASRIMLDRFTNLFASEKLDLNEILSTKNQSQFITTLVANWNKTDAQIASMTKSSGGEL